MAFVSSKKYDIFYSTNGRRISSAHEIFDVLDDSMEIVDKLLFDKIVSNKLAQEFRPQFIIKFIADYHNIKLLPFNITITDGGALIYYLQTQLHVATGVKVFCYWDVIKDKRVISYINCFTPETGVFNLYKNERFS